MLVYLSDGGADHNMTHLSAQCGIITVCILLKLDYAVFFCIITGHSLSNVVERVMSVLNLSLQGVYLARAAMDTGKFIMKRCCGSAEILAAAKSSVYFKQKLPTSIDAVIKPLESIFESLRLKGGAFRSLPSTTADALQNFGQKFLILTQPLTLKN